MSYFSDWLESHGFTKKEARILVESTFTGAGLTSSASHQKSIETLIEQIASKKGVTSAGLESMRALELDRLIRMSLDSAQKRNEELARLLG
jgi:pyrroline-5-carboxylate reductase